MATTTPNFGWSVPTSTDLVKDGATAIETLGDAIDASLVDLKGGTSGQVLKKNSNTDMDFVWSADSVGMTNPMTTTGDTIYSSSGSTPARLGIGTAGQVLKVNSGATAPEWGSASATTAFTLLATQSITTGSSYSITGLSGYNTLFIVLAGLSSTAAGTNYAITLNSDTGSNYNIGGSGFDSTAPSSYNGTDTKIQLGTQGSNVANTFSGSVQILGTNGTDKKVGIAVGGGNGTSSTQRFGGFAYNGTSVISSVQVTTSGTFDAGTVYIYGSVA